jgi:hypothetical protein
MHFFTNKYKGSIVRKACCYFSSNNSRILLKCSKKNEKCAQLKNINKRTHGGKKVNGQMCPIEPVCVVMQVIANKFATTITSIYKQPKGSDLRHR